MRRTGGRLSAELLFLFRLDQLRSLPELRHFHFVLNAPWLRWAVRPHEAYPLLAGERHAPLDHIGQHRIALGCHGKARAEDDGHLGTVPQGATWALASSTLQRTVPFLPILRHRPQLVGEFLVSCRLRR